MTTTGFPVPTITRAGAALPTGVTWIDNGDGTGTLGGTAAAGTGGTYALTFTASNGVGAPAVQTFTLTVNGAPAFTSANTTTFTRRHARARSGGDDRLARADGERSASAGRCRAGVTFVTTATAPAR